MSEQGEWQMSRAYNEADMLQGNIARMFVTHEIEELRTMMYSSLDRVARIYYTNKHRITGDWAEEVDE